MLFIIIIVVVVVAAAAAVVVVVNNSPKSTYTYMHTSSVIPGLQMRVREKDEEEVGENSSQDAPG